MIILVDLHYYDIAADEDKILRVASAPYIHYTAPGPYADRIVEIGAYHREIFADAEAFGSATSDFGAIRLANAGGLDWLDAVAVDGRTVNIWMVEDEDTIWDDRVQLASLTATSVQIGLDYADVMLADETVRTLDEPIQQDVFLGDNASGNGVQGGESLKDVWVPVAYGQARGVQPVLVNSAKRIYVAADRNDQGGTDVIPEVLDGGGPVTKGTSYPTMAALEAATTPAGAYDYCPGSPTERVGIKLGSQPSGDIIIKLAFGDVATRNAGDIFYDVLTQRCGVSTANIDATDLADFKAANSSPVGSWSGRSEETIRSFLDFIVSSVGGGFWIDQLGKWRVARIALPVGSPVVSFVKLDFQERPGTITDFDIVEMSLVPTSRNDGGLPYNGTTCRFARNYATYSRDQIAEVALSRLEELTTEWQEASAEDPSIKVIHPHSVDKSWNTALALRDDAQDEADRRLAMFGARLRRFKVTTPLVPALSSVDLNDVVYLEYNRYGLDNGKLFRVSGIRHNILVMTAEYTVWATW